MIHMTVKERVELCRLIEEMNRHKEYCEKIGVKNTVKEMDVPQCAIFPKWN